jgi:carbon-monoxide dehydrogenase medium subunit
VKSLCAVQHLKHNRFQTDISNANLWLSFSKPRSTCPQLVALGRHAIAQARAVGTNIIGLTMRQIRKDLTAGCRPEQTTAFAIKLKSGTITGPILLTRQQSGANVTQTQFTAPTTVKAAIRCLAEAGKNAKVLAGGTDLLVQLRSGRVRPSTIVDLKKIPELRQIKAEKGGFRIGAAVAGAELSAHAAIKKAWPGLVEGLDLIGSTQIQGRASLGGNLCNGSPAADSVPTLIAAAAICKIAGPNGLREAKAESIVTGPGKISLKKGEFIVSFFLPKRPKLSGDAYLRLIPRTEMDIAVVGAGVSLVIDKKGICTDARVALGAVAPKPLLVKAGAKALIGTTVDEAALEALAAAASAACNPIDDKRGTIVYRTKIAGVLARRAALIALDRAKGN